LGASLRCGFVTLRRLFQNDADSLRPLRLQTINGAGSVMRLAWSSLFFSVLALTTTLSSTGCKRRYEVGDKVLVEWEKNTYPAVILETNGPTKIKVHYEGYDPIWDETVPGTRIKGFNDGTAPRPEPPPKVRAKALQAAQTNVYKIGDRVRVEWHGAMYPAIIVGIVGQERYRIHFEGYGDEWDDTVGLNRIQQR